MKLFVSLSNLFRKRSDLSFLAAHVDVVTETGVPVVSGSHGWLVGRRAPGPRRWRVLLCDNLRTGANHRSAVPPLPVQGNFLWCRSQNLGTMAGHLRPSRVLGTPASATYRDVVVRLSEPRHGRRFG